ncbi:MAG: hypothetical protein Q8L39_04715 [Burkholderiales bacterium]|nr:hypothetical protein [Burkholderiales bacterium]
MSEGLCFVLGAGFGAWLAWHFWLDRAQPKVELKIDPAVLSQINSLVVTAWLEQRGLVWMPKGVDFKATVKKS